MHIKIGNFEVNWSKKSASFGGNTGVDLEVNSPYGRNFYSLRSADLSKYMNAIWGVYSDTSLLELFHSIGEIYAPIHLIADNVAAAEWQLRKTATDEIVYDNKDINRLFAQPNPLQNFQELIYEGVVYEIVTGKNFLYANVPDTLSFNYKNISTLLNLWADQVYIEYFPTIKLLTSTEIGELIKSYNVTDGAGYVPIPPYKVLYTKHPSFYVADKKIRGKSPLLSAQKAICNLIAAYEARNIILVKQGALGFFVSNKSDETGQMALTPKEKEEAIKDYTDSYGITGDKSPVGFTRFPLSFVKTGMSIQDLQPFDETKADAAQIYSILKVPEDLMPQPKGSTFENQNQAEKRLFENAVIPRANKIAQSLTNFLKLNEVGLYLYPSFDKVKVLQENLKEKASVDWQNNELYRMQFSYGLITLNTWMARYGYERTDANGKVIEDKNSLYNKLIFDMTPEELTIVDQILQIVKPGNASSALRNQDNVAGN